MKGGRQGEKKGSEPLLPQFTFLSYNSCWLGWQIDTKRAVLMSVHAILTLRPLFDVD